MLNRGTLRAAGAVLSALTFAVLLGGCAAGPAPARAAASAAGPVASATATATPTPAAQPLDARSAWNACEPVAQEQYVAENPGSEVRPFGTETTLQTAGDGATYVIVGVSPAQPTDGTGSIAVICFVSGTADAPHVDSWTMKDV
jgi:hypothetical protein